MQTDTVPAGEDRTIFFDSGEINSYSQKELLNSLASQADNCVIVSRLERDLDLKEFQKICSYIGKPKEIIKIAHYSGLMQRSVIISFDSAQDKRHFLHVLRVTLPDYLAMDTSKNLKVFCMSKEAADSDIDFKEFFQRKFPDVSGVWLTTGSELLMADYRLSKHPFFQMFMPLKTVVAEFPTSGSALSTYLNLNEAVIQHGTGQYLPLLLMFEPDEEQKAQVVDKKEAQKLDDEAEKSEKHIDTYIMKQMAMVMSGEQIKERGYDKMNAQNKAIHHFRFLAEHIRKEAVNNIIQTIQGSAVCQESSDEAAVSDTARQLLYLQEANKNQGPFSRMTEPVAMTMLDAVPRYWGYDQLKYTQKRDPSIADIKFPLGVHSTTLGNQFEGLANECVNRKDIYSQMVCCATHATALSFLEKDPRNISRDFGKLTLNCFALAVGASQGTEAIDHYFYDSTQFTKQLLGAYMPLLNSVQLWGRYKQKIQGGKNYRVLVHETSYLGQSYYEGQSYRNASWIFGVTQDNKHSRLGQSAIYEIKCSEEYFNSIIEFPNSAVNLIALPPFQVLRFISESQVTGETQLNNTVLFKFQVCGDYKDKVYWQRKEVIKRGYNQQ